MNEEKLIKPDYEIVGVSLYLGDCLEILPNLPERSVDAVFTDPPYGIGFKYANGKEATSNAEEYWEWYKPIHGECIRCSKDGGLVAVWQTQLYYRHFWEWFGDDIHIYIACKNFVQIRKTAITHAYDPVIMFYAGNGKPMRNPSPKRTLDWSIGNTAATLNRPKGHTCPRPLNQVFEIVENFTLPSGIVLDPFMGSGTTGVACIKAGRKFIGIEKEEKYFDIAVKRIEAVSKEQYLPLTNK